MKRMKRKILKRKIYAVIHFTFLRDVGYVFHSSEPVMCVFGSFKSACAYIYSIYERYGEFFRDSDNYRRDYFDGHLKIYREDALVSEFFIQSLELH